MVPVNGDTQSPIDGSYLVAQSNLTLQPHDRSPPGSSVRGISQARVLQWVAISFSSRSFQPRDQIHVSGLAGSLFTPEPPGKSPGEGREQTEGQRKKIFFFFFWFKFFLSCHKTWVLFHKPLLKLMDFGPSLGQVMDWSLIKIKVKT